MTKRHLKLAVISDVHLGTYGCHARELAAYLKSIEPEILVLNGDIIDIWQFSKNYWPKSHMKVVNRILKMAANGVKVYYITGNHDEMLRKFTDFELGNMTLVNKLVLNLDGKTAWMFHGDVFDVTMKHSKWLAKLGGKGYDLLIVMNRFLNWMLVKLGRQKISFSKKIKNSVKSAVSFISDFETTATDLAIEKGYDYVVCGHIHQPVIKTYSNKNGSVCYMNSGDWVENLTALEYNDNAWTLYNFSNDKNLDAFTDVEEREMLAKNIKIDLMNEIRSGLMSQSASAD